MRSGLGRQEPREWAAGARAGRGALGAAESSWLETAGDLVGWGPGAGDTRRVTPTGPLVVCTQRWGQQQDGLGGQAGAWQGCLSPRPPWSLEDQLGVRWEVGAKLPACVGFRGPFGSEESWTCPAGMAYAEPKPRVPEQTHGFPRAQP